ncbi:MULTISPECIES: SMI1/KNR4 family protein [unclassified Pseudomonas]|uniref:SMI1/KNR4 family protein n=1 Tax=unclassified Pseudomonas TaxID=196821 RepID=UPI002E8174EC|nr:SMI1/KNR4 family protein [Pseudomonas sp. 10C3]MEE3507118.1 SMI1/KNR4 family protein [Pseudomonas sp. 10C3]
MKVEVKEVRGVEFGAFEAVEAFVGRVLNNSIRLFFEKFNGGKPALNIFDVGSDNNSGVNQFIPIDEVVSELERFEFREGFIPIAWAEGGNYLAVDLIDGCVYFVDHEILDGYVKLSVGIDAFLDGLNPSSNDDVVLKPGQVIKVWVNPNPIKGLKNT